MATTHTSTPFKVFRDPHPRSTTYYDEFCRRKRFYAPTGRRTSQREKGPLYEPKPRPLTAARHVQLSASAPIIPQLPSTAPASLAKPAPPANAKNGSLWWKNYGPTQANQVLPTFRTAHGWRAETRGDNATQQSSTYLLSRPQYSHRPNYLPGGRVHPHHTENTDAFWWQKSRQHHVV